jgi:ADP-ribose pyrophosphatase YjhB (NUDIX family)
MQRLVRPIAIAIIEREDELLVERGLDPVAQKVYYRPLGGGIEFDEMAEDTVRREFVEELGLAIERLNPLTVLQNHFVYAGEERHEIIFVFKAEFTDPEVYLHDTYKRKDNLQSEVTWVKKDEFRQNRLILYPNGLSDFI